MRLRGHLRWVVPVVAVAMLASACSGGDSTDTTPDDGDTTTDDGAADDGDDGDGGEASGPTTLVVGTDAEPTTLDTQLIDDNGKDLSIWSVNEGLVDFDPDGNLEPILAASLPQLDPDDPERWIVELRQGVEFTDGTPFGAEAVVFNVERILNPDYGSVFAGELGNLVSAEVIDEHTVALITDGPDPILDTRLRVMRIVSPTAAEQSDYAENPVGTGPYIFESWQRGQSLTLVKNENYWGDPKPVIDTVELRFLPDVNTRISALEAGEIDIAINLPPTRAEGLNTITAASGTEAGGLVYDIGEFPYSELEFRQALQYAIDNETISQQLYGGVATPTRCQPVVPTATGFNDELEAPPYDPEQAMELLAGLDLPDDFVINFQASTAVYSNDREVSEALAGFWRAVGLEVDMTLNEIDPYLDAIYTPQESNGIVIFWTDQALNHAARQVGTFVQDGSPVASRGDDQFNELDPVVETALTSLDAAEREAAFDEIWRTYCEQAIMGFTVDIVDVAGISDRVSYEPDAGKMEKMDYHRLQLSS